MSLWALMPCSQPVAHDRRTPKRSVHLLEPLVDPTDIFYLGKLEISGKSIFHVSRGCDCVLSLGSLLKIVLLFIRDGKPHGKWSFNLKWFVEFFFEKMRQILLYFILIHSLLCCRITLHC